MKNFESDRTYWNQESREQTCLLNTTENQRTTKFTGIWQGGHRTEERQEKRRRDKRRESIR